MSGIYDPTEMTMTQALIANMLGVRPEGVTEAAGKLQKLFVIRYLRGQITVLDRSKLEPICCKCYAVVQKETDRLIPYVRHHMGGGAAKTRATRNADGR